MVFALLVAAAVARLLRLRRFSAFQRCIVLLGVMLLLAIVRGMAAFGVEQSVAEFRLYFAFASATLYFATFPPSASRNDRIGMIWLAASIPMMVLVCLRWLATFAGIDLGVPPEKFGADAAIRAIDGPYTFFLAHAAVLTVPFWGLPDERARRLTRLGVVLLLFAVVLDRRTVWLALLVGVAVIMLRNRRLGRRAVVAVAAAAVTTAAVYLALPRLGRESGRLTSSGTGTLDWRIEGWQALLETWSRDPVSWLIGQPFGSGFARRVEGMEVVLEAHNFYLTTLLRTGTRRPRGAHRAHRWPTSGAVAGPGGRQPWTVRGGRIPGIASDAARLARHLDTRDRAGNRHRPGCGAGDGTRPYRRAQDARQAVPR